MIAKKILSVPYRMLGFTTKKIGHLFADNFSFWFICWEYSLSYCNSSIIAKFQFPNQTIFIYSSMQSAICNASMGLYIMIYNTGVVAYIFLLIFYIYILLLYNLLHVLHQEREINKLLCNHKRAVVLEIAYLISFSGIT